MIPKWREFGTSLCVIASFVMAVTHLKVTNAITKLRLSQEQRSEIAHPHVTRQALVGGEIALFCLVASHNCSSALSLAPYALILCAFSIRIVRSEGFVSISKLSSSLTFFTMAFILAEMSTQYLLAERLTPIHRSLGLAQDPSEVVFKCMLLFIQYFKLTFTHNNYQRVKNQEGKGFDITKLMQPISAFSFSAFAFVYILFHPSRILLAFMPLTVACYFMKSIRQPSRWYYYFIGAFLGVLIFEAFAIRCFKAGIILTYLLQNGKVSQECTLILDRLCAILGFSMRALLKGSTDSNVNTADFAYLLTLAIFGRLSWAAKEHQPLPNHEQQTPEGREAQIGALTKNLDKLEIALVQLISDGEEHIKLLIVLISAFFKGSILSLFALPLIFSTHLRNTWLVAYLAWSIIVQVLLAFEDTQWRVLLDLCQQGQKCSLDWEHWLVIGLTDKASIMVDFTLLLFAVIVRQNVHKQDLSDDEKISNVEQLQASETIRGKVNAFVYSFLPGIFIASLFLYAAASSGRASDLLSTVYLLFALNFLINFQKFVSKKAGTMLSSLRIYNFVDIALLLAFQSPLFECPISTKGDLSHYQCAMLMSQDGTDLEWLRREKQDLKSFYIILVNSIGLTKVQIGSIPWGLLLITLLTEIQHSVLSHPFYLNRLVPREKHGGRSDQLMRAIKFIEDCHLQKLWAFKAIKEEIKILHSRLIRITESIKNSVHSNHLLWDLNDEDYQGDLQRESLISEESSQDQERLSLTSVGVDEELDPDLRARIETHLEKILDAHSNDIENLALDFLNKPNAAIVPLKLFKAAFENLLQQKFWQKFSALSVDERQSVDLGSIIRIDQRAIEEYLIEIGEKLQTQVLTKARIDLYNHSKLGLRYLSENGFDEVLLREGEHAFFSKALGCTGEPRDRLLNVDTERPPFYDEQGWKKFKNNIRFYLWTHLIDHSLIMSLGQQEERSLYDMDLLALLGYTILSLSVQLAYIAMFLGFILNADILSLVLPLSTLLYSLLIHPHPSKGYWKLAQSYQLGVLVVKFFYQFPVFCPTPQYSLYAFEECNLQQVPAEALLKRFDYILGVHKYSGPASYPQDQGILWGTMPDLIVLFMILNVRIYFTMTGRWNHFIIKSSIYDTPAFKCLRDFCSEEIDKSQKKAERDYQGLSVMEKLKWHLNRSLKQVKKFALRLLPVYMKPLQYNRDIRFMEDEQHVLHNVKRVKPGKDYFNKSFFSLLLIFVFNLFFFRSWTGQTHASALSSANLQRFSVSQVAVLFLILILMMAERMLYRVRQTESLRTSSLSKHQLAIKLAMHVILVFYVHIDIGFIIPKRNNITFDKKFPLVLMYLLWVYYFVQSALQIRHGYPQAPFKAPFIRDTSLVTVWAFRVYKAMPFLWEMKVIIDWTVTSTCLDLYQWFKLDDAFNYLYQCQIQNNDRAQRREFSQRPMWEKFFQGFCFAFALILIILAPILLFSGINPIMVNNPVLSGELQISLSLNENGMQYDLLRTQAFHIAGLNQSEVEGLQDHYAEGSVKFEYPKMQKMYFSPYSEYSWQISPPSLSKFTTDYQDLLDDPHAFFEIKAKWILKRDNPIGNEHASSHQSVRLQLSALKPVIEALSEQAGLANRTSTILVEGLLPKFLKLGDSQQATPMDVIPLQSNLSTFASAKLTLNHGQDFRGGANQSGYNDELYWTYQVLERDREGIFRTQLGGRDDNLVLVVYNEQVIGSLFGTALQLSVVGLYATIVIAIGRFLRLAFDRISQRVIYEEMDPETTEQLFEICEGIYIAQLEGDLVKEKRLYDLLIRIYRSPETLVKINRANRQLEDRPKNE